MARRFIRPRLSDQQGNVLSGGWLRVLAAGTDTEVDVFAAAVGGTALAQPLSTDARGEVKCWLIDSVDVDLEWSDSGATYRGGTSRRAAFSTFTEFVEAPPAGGGGGSTLHADLTDLATSGHPAAAISGLGGAALLDVGAVAGTVAAGDDGRFTPSGLHADLTDLATSGHPASAISGLGGAATLNVGTGAGTVAAGDDSRFPPSGTGYLSGNYYAPLFAGGYSTAFPSSNAVNSNNQLQFCQFRCNAAFTADRITIDIRSAGDAGSVVRVGIWRDSGFGKPGTLVLDAGTVSGTTVATQSITISQALTPGMYWLGAVWQGLSAVNPTWTALNATTQTANMENQIANPATNNWAYAWAAQPVSGALASNPTVFAIAGGTGPRIWLRAA